MKKLHFLSIIFFFFGFTTSKGQFTVLHNFDSVQGEFPYGSLIASGNVLYGMASNGGATASGCIFSINSNGSNFRDLYDFKGDSGGMHPGGSLLLSGNKFYGMTSAGGSHLSGCIFSVDTNGNNYKDIFNFYTVNGGDPDGSLIRIGGKLFGMTTSSARFQNSNIFSIDTNGNNYKVLLDFGGTTTPQGNIPYGDLLFTGGKLYGMTSQGGVYNSGCIFTVDTNGTNYKDLHNFNDTNGANPYGNLIVSGHKLYGMTLNGGLSDSADGIIFSIDINGSAFKVMFGFDLDPDHYKNGYGPEGSLTQISNKLYGMAAEGGIVGNGVIFSIDTSGNNFTNIHNFNDTNGSWPDGNLTLSGNNLFGMTSAGGQKNKGVIFSIDYTTVGINELNSSKEAVSIFPNPSTGTFTFQLSAVSQKSLVEIYNMLGEKVYAASLNSSKGGTSTIVSLSDCGTGVYLYRITTTNGSLISTGKLIKE